MRTSTLLKQQYNFDVLWNGGDCVGAKRIVTNDFSGAWAAISGDREHRSTVPNASTDDSTELHGVGIAKTFHFNELENDIDVNAMTILRLSRGLRTKQIRENAGANSCVPRGQQIVDHAHLRK